MVFSKLQFGEPLILNETKFNNFVNIDNLLNPDLGRFLEFSNLRVEALSLVSQRLHLLPDGVHGSQSISIGFVKIKIFLVL